MSGALLAMLPAVAASASVTLTVSPSAGLVDGQRVQISADGFSASTFATQYVWAECPATATSLADCQVIEYFFGGAGSLSLWVPVYRDIQNGPATVQADCAVTQCFVAMGHLNIGSFMASVPVSFSNKNTCTSSQPCNTTQTAAATAQAPGLNVNVTGTPRAGGNVQLKIASGTLKCPQISSDVRPVANLTDTGFPQLTVTATLPLASSTSPEQVCFQSTVPFRSQSSSTPKAGTAFLSSCSQTANKAPCVQSSKQVGSNAIVRFVVPGGDPKFIIVDPSGREVWLSKYGLGTVGKPFDVQLHTRGGILPATWNIASGPLPNGCTLNPDTGTITGTPTKKGDYPVVVEATDSERPAKHAKLKVPITIS